jgi:hypothetical protein
MKDRSGEKDMAPRHLLPALLLLALPLMGMSCSGMSYKASADCKTGGGGCTIHGEIGGTLPFAPQGIVEQTLYALTGTADAGAFSLDMSDSTVTIPATGSLTVKLINSASGITRASKNFPWKRVGTNIVLTDPNSVNAWAMNNGGDADSVDYDLLPFVTSESNGWNTLAVAANYEGETQAYATTTWKAQFCPNDPLKAKHGRGAGIRYCP